jgi:hypothetical protein
MSFLAVIYDEPGYEVWHRDAPLWKETCSFAQKETDYFCVDKI